MSKSPKSIRKLLSSQPGGLGRILNKNAQINKLNSRVNGALPKQLAQHCLVAGIDKQTLIIYADSTAWATRLRLAIPGLLKTLKKDGITAIEARIQPPASRAKIRPSRRAQLSQSASKQLLSLAKTIQEPKLKAALERLAKHSNSKDKN